MFKLLFKLAHQTYYCFQQFSASIKECSDFFFSSLLKTGSSIQMFEGAHERAIKPYLQTIRIYHPRAVYALRQAHPGSVLALNGHSFPLCYSGYPLQKEQFHRDKQSHSAPANSANEAMPQLTVRQKFLKAGAGICTSGISVFLYQKQQLHHRKENKPPLTK